MLYIMATVRDEYRNNLVQQINIFLTKTTAAKNEVALSYHRVRVLYFLAVVFAATIISSTKENTTSKTSSSLSQ